MMFTAIRLNRFLPFLSELASVFLLMAMVGAIILARRDILPDEVAGEVPQAPALSLPERPRELVSASGETSSPES